jgi:hypothetical protein
VYARLTAHKLRVSASFTTVVPSIAGDDTSATHGRPYAAARDRALCATKARLGRFRYRRSVLSFAKALTSLRKRL